MRKSSMPKVVVTVPLPAEVLATIAPHADCQVWTERELIPSAVLHDWLRDADGLLCSLTTSIGEETLQHANALKVISSISVGLDHINVDAARQRGIDVGHTPGVLVDSTADLAVGLMLDSCRRITEADRMVRAGGWDAPWSTAFLLGRDLSGATVGIVGLGPIGQAVAKRLRGFGCRLLGWNRTPRPVLGVELVELDELFRAADIITLHTALHSTTQHLVDARRLALMQEGALLINTGRGGLVDQGALVQALTSGRLWAGLDVYEQEPLPPEDPLLALPNVVLSPHLGSATLRTREAMMRLAIANLLAGLAGKPLPHAAPS